jgi:hypothetical protein
MDQAAERHVLHDGVGNAPADRIARSSGHLPEFGEASHAPYRRHVSAKAASRSNSRNHRELYCRKHLRHIVVLFRCLAHAAFFVQGLAQRVEQRRVV